MNIIIDLFGYINGLVNIIIKNFDSQIEVPEHSNCRLVPY